MPVKEDEMMNKKKVKMIQSNKEKIDLKSPFNPNSLIPEISFEHPLEKRMSIKTVIEDNSLLDISIAPEDASYKEKLNSDFNNNINKSGILNNESCIKSNLKYFNEANSEVISEIITFEKICSFPKSTNNKEINQNYKSKNSSNKYSKKKKKIMMNLKLYPINLSKEFLRR